MSCKLTTTLFQRQVVLAILMVAAMVMVLSQNQITQAIFQTIPTDKALPNVAVYEIPGLAVIQQVSVHAPGTIPPAFVVPYGQYVTPNGRFAMAEPSASTFEIYDLQTDTKVAGWSYANGSFVPTSVAVSPNGMYAAISSVSTVNSTWTITLFNVQANTVYSFGGTNGATAAGGSATLQSQPRIEGWTGDESAVILSTLATNAPEHLFFKMPMANIAFAASASAGSPVPPVTAFSAAISRLVFSPDSTRAAFLYADPGNTPVNFAPVNAGVKTNAPPNGIKVIDLLSGTVASIVEAAAGQGITAPAWSPDGSKLYFGAGPYQGTPFPVNIHIVSYDFSTQTSTLGDTLIATDPAHTGISDLQICIDNVFMREITVGNPDGSATPAIVGRITSAPLIGLSHHADVYPTFDNALGPCVPALNKAGSGPGGNTILPGIPTTGSSSGCVPTPTPTLPVSRNRPTFTPTPPALVPPIHITATFTPTLSRFRFSTLTPTPTLGIIRIITYTPTVFLK